MEVNITHGKLTIKRGDLSRLLLFHELAPFHQKLIEFTLNTYFMGMENSLVEHTYATMPGYVFWLS